MRYMFLIYRPDLETLTDSEIAAGVNEASREVILDARAKGVFRGAEPLRPASTATTVRRQNGHAVTVDGPFAETKEQLAGYYILDCENLDEALDWAKRIPCSGEHGSVEIRPIREISLPV